jgi:hypothetical protein
MRAADPVAEVAEPPRRPPGSVRHRPRSWDGWRQSVGVHLMSHPLDFPGMPTDVHSLSLLHPSSTPAIVDDRCGTGEGTCTATRHGSRQPARPGGHRGGGWTPRVSVRHVRKLVAQRRIPYLEWGNLLRFDPNALAALLDEKVVPAQTESWRASTGAGPEQTIRDPGGPKGCRRGDTHPKYTRRLAGVAGWGVSTAPPPRHGQCWRRVDRG